MCFQWDLIYWSKLNPCSNLHKLTQTMSQQLQRVSIQLDESTHPKLNATRFCCLHRLYPPATPMPIFQSQNSMKLFCRLMKEMENTMDSHKKEGVLVVVICLVTTLGLVPHLRHQEQPNRLQGLLVKQPPPQTSLHGLNPRALTHHCWCGWATDGQTHSSENTVVPFGTNSFFRENNSLLIDFWQTSEVPKIQRLVWKQI